MITIMATRIGQGRKAHLYIDEHISAKGMNKNKIADRLDIHRSTVGKWLKKGNDISISELMQLAHALGLEDYREFHRPPGETSVDFLIEGAPAHIKDAIIDFAKKAGRG